MFQVTAVLSTLEEAAEVALGLFDFLVKICRTVSTCEMGPQSAVFLNPPEDSHHDGHRRRAFGNSQGTMTSFKKSVIKVGLGVHGFHSSIDAEMTHKKPKEQSPSPRSTP